MFCSFILCGQNNHESITIKCNLETDKPIPILIFNVDINTNIVSEDEKYFYEDIITHQAFLETRNFINNQASINNTTTGKNVLSISIQDNNGDSISQNDFYDSNINLDVILNYFKSLSANEPATFNIIDNIIGRLDD